MRRQVIQRASGVRASKSLAIRAELARTFVSLAAFIVVTFLCWGFYILADAFAHPIEAGAAAILLFFLIKPLKRSRTS